MSQQFMERILFRSPLVTIRDVRCRPHSCEHQPEEASDANSIVFTRSGVFEKHVDGKTIIADANHAIFFTQGQPYRVSHPVPGGDDCTVFRFAPDVLIEACRLRDPAVVDRPDSPFRVTHSLCHPDTFLAQQRLRVALRTAPLADPLPFEEQALGILDRLMESCRTADRQTVSRQTDTARAHQEHVYSARSLLARSFRERLSLDAIARRVHSSPFHLARLFRREVGITLHQYVNRLRLRAALECIADGCDDLTALALDLGFSSHSHFTQAFRREFHITPSSLGRLSIARMLREVK
jgi:AraC-like DNA-binding protein